MRIFITRPLARFARKEGIAEAGLVDAVERAERGLIDADLGGGLIKQRVARKGQGRSGGYRLIVAFRVGSRAVFLYGFAKSALDNIDDRRLAQLRALGQGILDATPDQLRNDLEQGILEELNHAD